MNVDLNDREQSSIAVGLGEIVVSKDPQTVLGAYGLGSGIVIAMCDSQLPVGGMLHAALPLSTSGAKAHPGRYVDTGAGVLLQQMLDHGVQIDSLVVRIAGGADMVSAPGYENLINIGQRNVAAAKLMLARENLSLAAADVGGHVGRTVHLYIDSGLMTVRVLGRQPRAVGTLGLKNHVAQLDEVQSS